MNHAYRHYNSKPIKKYRSRNKNPNTGIMDVIGVLIIGWIALYLLVALMR